MTPLQPYMGTAGGGGGHSALSRMETQKFFFAFLGPIGPN